ncbi:MAG: OmpA family protein [uncultured Thiotrichaceae bacterium]|uniref:OmpA family protein n=1 Tax=uncultured Thiotrichaceae bacterium TaxID=298394 RepID=A0A6S6SEU7_9GAMM|nr:MAG: OmpA family protein [uncultured Thiotrichaceae bacterium]
MINALDPDDDGDGDPTSNEAPDPNQDGDPDDAQDVDNDGIPDYLDPATSKMSEDSDGDGISNGREKVLGTNPMLTDSDGDGLSDSIEIEGEKDTDNDGTIDALDPDDDDDGIMTAMENADPDGDGDPKDALDGNGNGIPDYLDTDNTPTELPDQTKSEPEPDTSSKQDEQTKSEEQPAAKSESKADDESEKTEAADDKKPAEDIQEDAEKDTKDDDSSKVTLDTSGNSDNKNSISKARLYFPFRSSEPELADSVAEYFDLIIKQLKDNPDVEIKVTGHTDSVGRGAANRRLGRQRAEQVRDMLVERGAPKSQITVDSKGEGEPIADNKTDAGRKKNRRVELEQVE